MATYSELLKDPRWQKKRLEILQKDNFECQLCGCKTKTLHVHHMAYYPGFRPWDYQALNLITLCEDCHLIEEGIKKDPIMGEGYLLKSWINPLIGDIILCLNSSKNRRETINKISVFLLELDLEAFNSEHNG